MSLIKVSSGLLEVENFYLISPFQDFLGLGTTHRDNTNFYIDDNVKIERNLNYSEFVIEIKKQNFTNLTKKDSFIFYVAKDVDMYGIEDEIKAGQSQYHKIIYNDKYLQCYISNDRKNWTNVGGLQLDSINKQGFKKDSEQSFILNEYKVYTNPYVTIQNLDQNSKVEFYDINNNLIKTRLFDENKICQIYLDYCMTGYFKIYDINNNLINTSQNLNLEYGDIYYYSLYEIELELIYNSVVLNENPTYLQEKYDVVNLKNISVDKTYENLLISTQTSYDDTIELSLDNITFTNTVAITTIASNQQIPIYIKIIKGATNLNFLVRNFEFKVTKAPS